MQKLKLLMAASALLSPSMILFSTSNSALWQNTENVFDVLAAAAQEFQTSKAAFTELASTYGALTTHFDTTEAQRQAAFTQVKNSIAALATSINTAQATHAQAATNAAAEQADLTNQISSTTADRQATINALITTKTALEAEIATLQQNITSLQNLDETKVAELGNEFDTMMASYNDMVAERQACLSVVNATLSRVQAYDAAEEADVATVNPPATPTSN